LYFSVLPNRKCYARPIEWDLCHISFHILYRNSPSNVHVHVVTTTKYLIFRPPQWGQETVVVSCGGLAVLFLTPRHLVAMEPLCVAIQLQYSGLYNSLYLLWWYEMLWESNKKSALTMMSCGTNLNHEWGKFEISSFLFFKNIFTKIWNIRFLKRVGHHLNT
jgi:hypothetical protein